MSSSYTEPGSSAYLPQRAETPEEARSIGEILTDVGQNVTTLLRQEVELAKAEAKQSASKAGKGIGMFAGAAVAGLMFLVFLSVAVWWALGTQIGNGWSGLIVAIVWAIIAGILAYLGKKELDKIRGLPDTAETVSQIPNAVTGHEERNQ